MHIGKDRFLSEDPIGLAGGINPYVFANNDPVNNSDPSGLDPDCSLKWIPGDESHIKGGESLGSNPGGWAVRCWDDSPTSTRGRGGMAGDNGLGTAGVYVGTWSIGALKGLARHAAIAIRYPSGQLQVHELIGWPQIRVGFNSSGKPAYGTFADYRWVFVANASMIGPTNSIVTRLEENLSGSPYMPPMSNVFVRDVLMMSGIGPLSSQQRGALGWAPGLTSWYR